MAKLKLPAPPTFPTWTAESLPCTKTDGDLSVTIKSATIQHSGSYQQCRAPRRSGPVCRRGYQTSCSWGAFHDHNDKGRRVVGFIGDGDMALQATRFKPLRQFT